MTEGNTNANNAADPAGEKAKSATEPAKGNRPPPVLDVIRDFAVVYGAEYADIIGQQPSGARQPRSTTR